MLKCCNKEIKINTGKQDGKNMYWAKCDVCNKHFKHTDKKEVEKYFNNNTQTVPAQTNYQLQPIPKTPAKIIEWGNSNLPILIRESAQFQDKPATERMIQKNLRYVANLSGKSFDKIWNTAEGQESIKYSLGEANYYAATLGEMGDIVPYGNTAEFIPTVECFKFALETGKNAPFKDIQIIAIYENDQIVENEVENGEFKFKYKMGIPRGEIIAIVVSGIRTDVNKRVGEIYDAERLLEKAKQHSPSYRQYIREKETFEKLRVEGKLKKDKTGKDYYVETIPKRDGTTWDKKIYADDITNPYDGPDRPEMLRKAAGKSFFRPYMKTRNASAMAEEWESEETEDREQAADNVLNKAASQFEGMEIQDAEIIDEKEVEKKSEDLFNE